jgi:hypothetical protein
MKPIDRLLKSGMAVGILAMSLVLAACSDSDDNDSADLRVIHASPDAPMVNVKAGSKTVIPKLDYANSSGYVSVRSGTKQVVVEAILPNGALDVITVPDFAFDEDARYNILAINETAAIAPQVVAESATEPGANEVAIAVVHASPTADAATAGAPVDVYVTDPAVDITDPSVLPAFSFIYEGVVDAAALPVGKYRIQVTLNNTKTVVYDSGEVDLSPFAGDKLLIAALDSVTGTEQAASPIKLLVANDTDQVVLLDAGTLIGARVAHFSPDAPAVDVFANAGKLISAIEYTETFPGNTLPVAPGYSDYANIAAGDYEIDVAVAPAASVATSLYNVPNLSLEPGTEYSIIALGSIAAGFNGPGSGDEFGLLPMIDDNRPVVTQASVKILHAAPAAGLVDIYVTPGGQYTRAEVESGLAGEPLLNDFAFGDLTDYVALTPDTAAGYDIRVLTATPTPVTAIEVLGFPLPAGVVATVIARQPDGIDSIPADFNLEVLTN